MPPKTLNKNKKQEVTKTDIKVTELSYVKRHKYISSHLTLNISGKSINHSIINSLRRVMLNNIPIHAFPPEMMTIEENTCVAFNNQYMKLRLSGLPIYNLKTDVFYLPENYWKNINFADPNRIKHPDEKPIDIYINVHNNSNQIKHVTTNDIKYYLDGDEIKPYDENYPILLINLRPNDTFKCHMKAALCIGNNHTRWCAASNSWYDYDDKNNFTFHIKSRGENDEYKLLNKACEYLLKKLKDIKNEFIKKEKANEMMTDELNCLQIELEGEDHTIGELLNYEFQSHPKILYSGMIKPDLLIRTIIIKLQGSEKNIVPYLIEQIELIEEKIQAIKEQI